MNAPTSGRYSKLRSVTHAAAIYNAQGLKEAL